MSDTVEPKKIIEALLFVTETPLTIAKLKEVIPMDIGTEELKAKVEELKSEYENHPHAFALQEVAGGYQIRTRPEYYPVLARLKTSREEGKLSNAALETMAIIAYKQPVLRAEIEAIRGVDSSAIIRGLMEKKLVRISGRADTLGHPLLYATTPHFLELLGLNSIQDLPKITELK